MDTSDFRILPFRACFHVVAHCRMRVAFWLLTRYPTLIMASISVRSLFLCSTTRAMRASDVQPKSVTSARGVSYAMRHGCDRGRNFPGFCNTDADYFILRRGRRSLRGVLLSGRCAGRRSIASSSDLCLHRQTYPQCYPYRSRD